MLPLRNIFWEDESIKINRVPVSIKLVPIFKNPAIQELLPDTSQLEISYQTILFRYELEQWRQTMWNIYNSPNGKKIINESNAKHNAGWFDEHFLKVKPFPKKTNLWTEKFVKLLKADVDLMIQSRGIVYHPPEVVDNKLSLVNKFKAFVF